MVDGGSGGRRQATLILILPIDSFCLGVKVLARLMALSYHPLSCL